MRYQIPEILKRWGFTLLIVTLIAAVVIFRASWWPGLSQWVANTVGTKGAGANTEATTDDHPSHDDEASGSLDLSAQARKNIGLTPEYLQPLELQTYRRTIAVPAVVVEKPGRSRLEVSTPLTGIITHVHAVEGEAVVPGTMLFEIRLTHEDLVQTQTELVQTLGELDVENKELTRLKGIANIGAIAGKLVLERGYAIDKLTALLNAQREGLRLHGLSEDQIVQIEKERRLLKSLQVFAPSPDDHSEDEFKLTGTEIKKISYSEESKIPLVIEELHVKKGQSVMAGDSLCELVDYSELYIEGRAFERDAQAVSEALQQDWDVTAVFEKSNGEAVAQTLPFAYLSNRVDQTSRILSFYVSLPNEIVRDVRNAEEQRYLSWKYRPGQRLQLLVPVEEWEGQFVLPVDAVTKEGAEYFVFQENGDHFDRVAVHVKHKDQVSVVIANDGVLFPGDVIARRGAHQMQMAIKNKSGGGVDPHAGHTH